MFTYSTSDLILSLGVDFSLGMMSVLRLIISKLIVISEISVVCCLFSHKLFGYIVLSVFWERVCPLAIKKILIKNKGICVSFIINDALWQQIYFEKAISFHLNVATGVGKMFLWV